MKQINDIVKWETVSGIRSGSVTEIKESQHGWEYKVLLPNNKVVWVNEKSIIDGN